MPWLLKKLPKQPLQNQGIWSNLEDVNKNRDILYGDDASEEIKKQIEALFETAQIHASKEEYQQVKPFSKSL